MPILPLLALLASLPAGAPQDAPLDPLPAKDAAITRAELEHHVRFLASDELEGRGFGTSGSQRAARYLAQALAAAGLEPAGVEGGWFQPLALRRYEYPAPPRLLWKGPEGEVQEAHYGVDFELRIRGHAHSTEMLPLRRFYGFNPGGIPQQGRPDEAVYFGATPNERRDIFRKRGIADLTDWGLEVELDEGEHGYEPGQPKAGIAPRYLAPDEKEGCEWIELRGPLKLTMEERKMSHLQLLLEEVESPILEGNVVGRIRGVGTPEHPELAQQVVVLSAHFDHLGVRTPRSKDKDKEGDDDKDRICNGADDDASGVATLLELAQAFAAGPKPARTLVFLFTTGEERGGFGSARYLAAPAEPLEHTVADLNLEMLGRPDELAGGAGKLWLTGDDRTNLGAAWREQGLAIVADPRPKEKFFQRSDNYAFALKGVVAQSLSSFNLHEQYHTPADEADTLDYAHLEAAARLAQRAAAGLADGSLQPAWLAGRQPKSPEELQASPPEPREKRPKGADAKGADPKGGSGGDAPK